MATREWNFDGWVGPTHVYGGLAHGNLASAQNARAVARPREAALQGLEKMQLLHELGVPQGLLPPLPRPDLSLLREVGFSGSEPELVAAAAKQAPRLLEAAYSASAMWTANAATVTASADAADGKVHLSPANLSTSLHRSREARDRATQLEAIFRGPLFVHHPPLPAPLSDEGAANHTRFVFAAPADAGAPTGAAVTGVELHVYGRSLARGELRTRFLPRHTEEASHALARRHGVRHAIFLQQAPRAIDAGVFHNDVIAVGYEDVLFAHEAAFTPDDFARLDAELAALGLRLRHWRVREAELSLPDTVRSYLFNSQLVRTARGLELIAPAEVDEVPAARAVVDRLLDVGELAAAHTLDLRQSMRNGGGPACLRLRVPLRDEEAAALAPWALYSPARATALRAIIEAHYREELLPADLADPQLLHETRAFAAALAELSA